MMRIVAVGMLVVAAASSTANAEPCNPAKLAALDRELQTLPASDRSPYAMELLREACTLPASILGWFERVRNIGDEVASSAEMRILAEEPKLWARSCKAGPSVFGNVGMIRGSLKRFIAKATWSACDVAALGIATESEWTITKHAVLALVVVTALRDAGLDAGHVRAYTRAITRLDVPPPPTLAAEYPDPGVPPSPPSKHVRATQASFLGTSTSADVATAAISAIADRFAACFAIAGAPKHTVVRLDLRDGVAIAGDLIEITRTGPSSTKIDHPNLPAKFRRCVFAIAATAVFAHDDDELQVEIDLTPGP